MEEKQSYWLCFFTLAVVTSVVFAAVPSAPVKLTISHIKPKSVQLTWDKSKSDDVLSYIIQYRPYSDESKEFKEISGITKTRGYKVHLLEPYTRYEFRVIAVNKDGRSPPSETVQELTAPQAPGTAPRNLRGKAASATTIALLWDEPEIPNGIIKGYKIFYTMNPDLPIILWDHKTHSDSQKRVATLTNLKTNSTYTINILAFSSAGQGPLSDEIQVMTNPGVPQQPKNLQAIAESPNTVHVTWDRPDAMDHIESYELYYNDSHYRQNVHISIKPPVISYRLVDLTPDTVYHVQVSAKSARGEGARTPTIQVRTPQFVPGAPPLAVSGIALDSHRLKITWKPPPPNKQNGDITGYKIMYMESGADKSKVINVDATVNSYILTDLATWTQYKILLLAFTSVGDGPTSPPILVSTEEDVPGDPRRVRVEAINSTAVFIEWRHPSSKERNGIIRGYQIQYIEINDDDIPTSNVRMADTMDGEKTEYVITNLEPDTKYQFTVAGYTRKGDGIRSKPKIVETKGAGKGYLLRRLF